MATLLIFWDYDTQWGADRSRTGGGKKAWGHLEFPNTDRLLELHAESELPACFAVVGRAAQPGDHPYHDPQQIRRIHAHGHEVASHSLEHNWLPALDPQALRQNLRDSKDALEQCIGAEVVSFVPPFDMPQDYPRGLAFNLTERREVPHNRTDVIGLCRALSETGYQFCRLAYRPFYIRLLERVAKRRVLDRPSRLEPIAGVTCLRTNTAPGFAAATHTALERFAQSDGYIVVYGHPHHLSNPHSAEGEHGYRPLLDKIKALQKSAGLKVVTPRQLLAR